ncbi:MAG: hypothetical protein ACPL28_11100 [bacterium]
MEKIYFEIERKEINNNTKYVVKVQIGDLLKDKKIDDLPSKIEFLEKLYDKTITFCKQRFAEIKNANSKSRVFMYWEIANKLYNFLYTTEQSGFIFNYPNRHFSRDLNISERTIRRLLMFRKIISKKTALDSTKPWTYYTRRYYRLAKDRKSEAL